MPKKKKKRFCIKEEVDMKIQKTEKENDCVHTVGHRGGGKAGPDKKADDEPSSGKNLQKIAIVRTRSGGEGHGRRRTGPRGGTTKRQKTGTRPLKSRQPK